MSLRGSESKQSQHDLAICQALKLSHTDFLLIMSELLIYFSLWASVSFSRFNPFRLLRHISLFFTFLQKIVSHVQNQTRIDLRPPANAEQVLVERYCTLMVNGVGNNCLIREFLWKKYYYVLLLMRVTERTRSGSAVLVTIIQSKPYLSEWILQYVGCKTTVDMRGGN